MVTGHRTKTAPASFHTGPFTVLHAPPPDLDTEPISVHRVAAEWAPIAGPLATSIWQRLTMTPPRTVVDPGDLALAFGVKRAHIERALDRCRQFGLVRHGLVASPFTRPHPLQKARVPECPPNLIPR